LIIRNFEEESTQSFFLCYISSKKQVNSTKHLIISNTTKNNVIITNNISFSACNNKIQPFLYKLTQRPKELCDKIFDRLFEEAEIAKFTPQEMREYEASKMAYRDIKNSIDTAKREGKIEANTETAQRLLAMGLSAEQVAKATLLPLKIIENLRNS
jgi:predicted transposase/invertase (TIGR01784 family)